MGILDGKKLLITGVLTEASIAFTVARLAQEQGAEIILSSFGRMLPITQKIAERLPTPCAVIELDATNNDDLAALESRVREHLPHLDGIVHAIAFAPQTAAAIRLTLDCTAYTDEDNSDVNFAACELFEK